MSREPQQNERIVDYLLGALPDAEAERLDELSVSDRSFAEVLAAAEHDLVDAYVRGDLAGEALARFRSHYLASPLRREKVGFARALHQYFAGSAVSARPRRAAVPVRWALAAAILTLAVAAGWLGYQNARLRQQVVALQEDRAAEQVQQQASRSSRQAEAAESELARLRQQRDRLESELQAVAVFPVALMPQLRSTGAPPSLRIPPGTTHVAFQLPLEPGGHSAVRVDLLDASGGRTLWTGSPLAPRTTGAGRVVDVTIRAELLRAGRYMLRVTALQPPRAAGVVGDYPFTVVRD